MTTPTPDPELRLMQRNDGRGVRAAARLDPSSPIQGGNSTQAGSAPRVGDRNRYS